MSAATVLSVALVIIVGTVIVRVAADLYQFGKKLREQRRLDESSRTYLFEQFESVKQENTQLRYELSVAKRDKRLVKAELDRLREALRHEDTPDDEAKRIQRRQARARERASRQRTIR